MKLKTLRIQDIVDKVVIVRVDFNEPLEKKGDKLVLADDTRLRNSLKTLKFLQKNGARVIMVSHLGRPGGKRVADLSLRPVADHLTNELGVTTKFVGQTIGAEVKAAVEKLEKGQVLLLENLRFHPEEKDNQTEFARKLASLADVYVNEAFSASHRRHASVVGIPKYIPGRAGFALEREVTMLSRITEKPARPLVVIVGGAKISDKVDAIKNLTRIADTVLVGGGVANNFLKAENFDVASSYLQDKPADKTKDDRNYVELANQLLDTTRQENTLLDGKIPLPKIIYPIDVVAAPSIDSHHLQTIELLGHPQFHNPKHHSSLHHLNSSLMFLDIGPKTRQLFARIIKQAQTVFWSGPMGVFEKPLFAKGTHEVARAIINSPATSIVGGGDTINAIRDFKLDKKFDYISSAGGAALEFLSGQKLPGLEPLSN